MTCLVLIMMMIYHNAVCRTAPATMGLSSMMMMKVIMRGGLNLKKAITN